MTRGGSPRKRRSIQFRLRSQWLGNYRSGKAPEARQLLLASMRQE
jgi:hypothetical protein